jgi:glycine/D-amino acid oxidase-like deaminating enzyme
MPVGPRAVIIGVGIVGCAVADELAERAIERGDPEMKRIRR